MKKTLVCFMGVAFLLCACSNTDGKETYKDGVNVDQSETVKLTDEEKEYLLSATTFTEDNLSHLDESSIKELLLGSGLERGVKTTGIVANGVTYQGTASEELSVDSLSSEQLSYEDLEKIIEKEENIRLSDFQPFSYTIEQREKDSLVKLPFAEKENAFIQIWYEQREEMVKISRIVAFFQIDEETSMTFDAFMDMASIKAMLTDQTDQPTISYICGSLSKEGCYVRIYNGLEDKVTVKKTGKLICQLDNGETKELDVTVGLVNENNYSLASGVTDSFEVCFPEDNTIGSCELILYLENADGEKTEESLSLELK